MHIWGHYLQNVYSGGNMKHIFTNQSPKKGINNVVVVLFCKPIHVHMLGISYNYSTSNLTTDHSVSVAY